MLNNSIPVSRFASQVSRSTFRRFSIPRPTQDGPRTNTDQRGQNMNFRIRPRPSASHEKAEGRKSINFWPLFLVLLAVFVTGCGGSPPVIDEGGTSGRAARPGEARTPGFEPNLPTPTPVARLELTLESQDPAWLRVTIDGQPVFEGQVEGGTSRHYEAKQSIRVRTSNAGALMVSINGEPLHTLDKYGKSVEQEWLLKNGRIVENKAE